MDGGRPPGWAPYPRARLVPANDNTPSLLHRLRQALALLAIAGLAAVAVAVN